METKLSKLQRWILEKAYAAIIEAGTIEPQKINWRDGYDHTKAHLLRVEVMRDYFGLPVHLITSFQTAPFRYLSLDTKRADTKQANAARVALARSLRRLEERGLVHRMMPMKSKRFRLLHLTAEGTELVRKLVPRSTVLASRLLRALNREEQKVFMQLLKKFVHLNNDESRAPLDRGFAGSGNGRR